MGGGVVGGVGGYDGFFDMINIAQGGLAIHGGIIAGFGLGVLYCKIKKMNMWLVLDIIAPAFLIAQSIGRWGNFANKEAHGPATTLEFLQDGLGLPNFIIEQMNIRGTYYHPTFLYESFWNFVGFIIVLILRRTRGVKVGELFAFYMIWYGFARFFIEYFRTDSLYLGNIKVNMLSSFIMMVIGLAIIIVKRSLKIENRDYVSVIEENE